jgi:hypothetical protein
MASTIMTDFCTVATMLTSGASKEHIIGKAKEEPNIIYDFFYQY